MGGSSRPAPAPIQPTATDPAVLEAMEKERELERRRRGRKSTVLTSSGVDLGAQAGKKTMLGQ